MKEKFIENGIEHVRNGDYYIPNLTVPDDKVYNIGKYGRMHAKFIKENRPDFYANNLEKVRGIIVSVIEDYKSGKITYSEAEFNARTRIYQSVKPNFNPYVEYMKDPLSRDIPSVDSSLFILARKVILE